MAATFSTPPCLPDGEFERGRPCLDLQSQLKPSESDGDWERRDEERPLRTDRSTLLAFTKRISRDSKWVEEDMRKEMEGVMGNWLGCSGFGCGGLLGGLTEEDLVGETVQLLSEWNGWKVVDTGGLGLRISSPNGCLVAGQNHRHMGALAHCAEGEKLDVGRRLVVWTDARGDYETLEEVAVRDSTTTRGNGGGGPSRHPAFVCGPWTPLSVPGTPFDFPLGYADAEDKFTPIFQPSRKTARRRYKATGKWQSGGGQHHHHYTRLHFGNQPPPPPPPPANLKFDPNPNHNHKSSIIMAEGGGGTGSCFINGLYMAGGQDRKVRKEKLIERKSDEELEEICEREVRTIMKRLFGEKDAAEFAVAKPGVGASQAQS